MLGTVIESWLLPAVESEKWLKLEAAPITVKRSEYSDLADAVGIDPAAETFEIPGLPIAPVAPRGVPVVSVIGKYMRVKL